MPSGQGEQSGVVWSYNKSLPVPVCSIQGVFTAGAHHTTRGEPGVDKSARGLGSPLLRGIQPLNLFQKLMLALLKGGKIRSYFAHAKYARVADGGEAQAQGCV